MCKERFHIACCGRSGSTFIYQALSRMGISILHESNQTWPIKPEYGIHYIAKHPDIFREYQGIIGWKWRLLTPSFSETFPLQFHLVRTPLRTIESALTHTDNLFHQVEKYIGKPYFIPAHYDEKQIKLGRAINYWIQYNKLAHKDSILLQIESFTPHGNSFQIFCKHVHLSTSIGQLFSTLPTNINTRQWSFHFKRFKMKRRKITWSLIKKDYPSQMQIIHEMAYRYGYDREHLIDGSS